MAKCRSCEILNSTQAHIKKALVTNFKGEKYITSVHLEQLLTPNLLHDILSHATWQSDHQTILDTKNIENQVGEIKSKALRLLALCIWIELPLSTFKRLFDEGLGDDNLPFSEPFTHPLIDATSSEVLLKSQTYFIPYTIYLDGVHHDFRAERPIPILFEESDDRIGCGSFSDVFKVEVDSDGHQKDVYALKRFKPSDEAEIIFHRERLLLEAIRRRPHNHILTHITSIKDHDTFYILFPLAQCNLRTFLNRTTAPGLHGNGVIWFFSQLKGLADALLHLHTLGDCGSKPRWTRDHNFIPSNPVLHGDIKPENILVYTSTSEASLWTFKLCDFGTAQNSNQSEKCITHQNIFFRGTQAYESPDLLKSNELSCMTDVYALGCVVLELFVWLFYPPGSEEIGFMTQRACDTLSSSSSFWKLEENGEVDLKPSVKRRLLDMEYTPCCGKLSFEYLLNMLWSVVYPLDHNKYSTVRFLNDIEASMAQAELDLSRNPNHFLDSTARSRGYATPLPSWISEMPDSFYEPPAERKPFKKDRRAFWNKLAHYSKLEKERAQQQAQHV